VIDKLDELDFKFSMFDPDGTIPKLQHREADLYLKHTTRQMGPGPLSTADALAYPTVLEGGNMHFGYGPTAYRREGDAAMPEGYNATPPASPRKKRRHSETSSGEDATTASNTPSASAASLKRQKRPLASHSVGAAGAASASNEDVGAVLDVLGFNGDDDDIDQQSPPVSPPPTNIMGGLDESENDESDALDSEHEEMVEKEDVDNEGQCDSAYIEEEEDDEENDGDDPPPTNVLGGLSEEMDDLLTVSDHEFIQQTLTPKAKQPRSKLNGLRRSINESNAVVKGDTSAAEGTDASTGGRRKPTSNTTFRQHACCTPASTLFVSPSNAVPTPLQLPVLARVLASAAAAVAKAQQLMKIVTAAHASNAKLADLAAVGGVFSHSRGSHGGGSGISSDSGRGSSTNPNGSGAGGAVGWTDVTTDAASGIAAADASASIEHVAQADKRLLIASDVETAMANVANMLQKSAFVQAFPPAAGTRVQTATTTSAGNTPATLVGAGSVPVAHVDNGVAALNQLYASIIPLDAVKPTMPTKLTQTATTNLKKHLEEPLQHGVNYMVQLKLVQQGSMQERSVVVDGASSMWKLSQLICAVFETGIGALLIVHYGVDHAFIHVSCRLC
jgi:hypothetical protein